MKKVKIITIILFSFCLIASIQYSAYATDPGGGVVLTDPLGGKTPQQLIGQVINGALGVVGSIALAMFIYGGFTWMLSAGNAEAVTKGKNILVWATIGLVVIFCSYALVYFVLNSVLGLK